MIGFAQHGLRIHAMDVMITSIGHQKVRIRVLDIGEPRQLVDKALQGLRHTQALFFLFIEFILMTPRSLLVAHDASYSEQGHQQKYEQRILESLSPFGQYAVQFTRS